MSSIIAWPAESARCRRTRVPILIPLLLLVSVSLLAREFDLDQVCQRAFWSPEGGWHLADRAWVRFLYRFGTWPALLLAGFGALAWGCSLATGRWRSLRPPGLYLALLLLLGPGLVINAVFKEHLHRPRPVQTLEFGGRQVFRSVGEPDDQAGGKSFPSGHASMGFYWLGLFVYCWNRNRVLAWIFGVLGLLHGSMMGVGRMAQGGHWFSDVLWAAGFVYITGWVLHYILMSPEGLSRRGNRKLTPVPQSSPELDPAMG